MQPLTDVIKLQHPDHIQLVEVGPRDGLQNVKQTLSVKDRVALIESLVDAGHTDVEVGSFVHPRWIPQMAQTGDVFRQLKRKEGVRYWALLPNMRGLDDALDAGVTHAAIFLSSSETHNKKNLNRSIDETLAHISKVAERARAEGIALRGYISTIFGCPFEGEVDFGRVLDIADALFDFGVQQVSLGDTTGEGVPQGVEEKLNAFLERFGRRSVALHIHDTRGIGLVIATLALRIGVNVFDTSVGGMGGCPYAPGAAGNLATEDLVHLLDGFHLEHDLDLRALIQISSDLESQHAINLSSKLFPYAKNKYGIT